MHKSVAQAEGLREVSEAVREIWYSYAEGYLPQVTGTEEDDLLYKMVDSRMPKGWTVSIQPSGSVYASKPILIKKSMGVLVVEKRSNGHQRMFEIAL